MTQSNSKLDLKTETLPEAILEEYRFVIEDPVEDFHFHTGRPMARTLDYAVDLLATVPQKASGRQVVDRVAVT